MIVLGLIGWSCWEFEWREASALSGVKYIILAAVTNFTFTAVPRSDSSDLISRLLGSILVIRSDFLCLILKFKRCYFLKYNLMQICNLQQPHR